MATDYRYINLWGDPNSGMIFQNLRIIILVFPLSLNASARDKLQIMEFRPILCTILDPSKCIIPGCIMLTYFTFPVGYMLTRYNFKVK